MTLTLSEFAGLRGYRGTINATSLAATLCRQHRVRDLVALSVRCAKHRDVARQVDDALLDMAPHLIPTGENKIGTALAMLGNGQFVNAVAQSTGLKQDVVLHIMRGEDDGVDL